MRYTQTNNVPIIGYEPFNQVLKTEVVSNDVCCAAGCDGPEFASLLDACEDRTET